MFRPRLPTLGSKKSYQMVGDAGRIHIRDNWLTEREFREYGGEGKTGATYDEMCALWTAFYLAKKDGTSAMVRIDDGTENRAWVYLRPGHEAAEILEEETHRTLKKWRSVPPWPTRAEQRQSSRQTITASGAKFTVR